MQPAPRSISTTIGKWARVDRLVELQIARQIPRRPLFIGRYHRAHTLRSPGGGRIGRHWFRGCHDVGGDKTVRLANLSTRGRVEDSDNVMIGGLIIGGPDDSTILIRAIDPALEAAD